MKLSKLNTVILTLTLLLSIISTVYLYSATPANASQPKANPPKVVGPGVFTGTDAHSWYTTFEGVLATPNEAPLFPYFHGDVEISVSRFGENVNPFATSAQVFNGAPISGVGFQYMDANGMPYDPIRNAQVDINHVVDGWKLVVTYKSAQTGTFRTVWAYALFSDYTTAGSPANGNTPSNGCPNVVDGWILCPYNTPMPASPGLSPHGGRKTNGLVQTSATPLVLVDTPRRIVVASVNTIFDTVSGSPTDTSTPVARLTLTFDFNKDTKTLIIIKDVKLLLDIKLANPLTEPDCENLGTSLATIAGANYVPRFPAAKSQGTGLACFELLDTEELDQAVSTATSVAGFAHFFDALNGEGQTTSKCLTIAGGAFNGDPLYHWDTSRPNCEYDVMQAIDQAAKGQEQHITSKAFWPVPDWFTVDAKAQSQFFTKLEGTATTDLALPPDVVGTSVQWNFILNLNAPNLANPALDARLAWRSVETLTVTDQNTGTVCQEPTPQGPGGTNTPTTVNQVTQSGGPFTTVVNGVTFTITTPLQELISSTSSGSLVYKLISTTTTGQTCTAGNVIDKEEAYFDNMVFNPWDLNQAARKHFVTRVQYFVATGSSNVFTTTSTAGQTPFVSIPGDSATCTGTQWTANYCWDSYGSFAERIVQVNTHGTSLALEKSCATSGTTYPPCNPAGPDTGKPDTGTLLVRGTDYTLNNCGAADTNTCTGFTISGSPPKGTIYKIIYSCNEDQSACRGYSPNTVSDPNGADPTWEWIVVGRDSAVADSAGAAMVTEAQAFNPLERVATTLAGLDMADQSGVNPTIPFVLTRFTTPASPPSDPQSDYTECAAAAAGVGSFLGACPEGARLHLRNDFSTMLPIDGANIITVGGPNANQVTNLANDFLSIVYRHGPGDLFSDGAWDELSTTGNVFSPAQMNCTPTTSGACTFPVVGSGVISTYMDVDGTVYAVIYGGNAQDTFWTAQYMLQVITTGITGGPEGVYAGTQVFAGTTSILLTINYESPHPPSITVFKELNTISEVFPEQDQ